MVKGLVGGAFVGGEERALGGLDTGEEAGGEAAEEGEVSVVVAEEGGQVRHAAADDADVYFNDAMNER